MFSRFIYLGRLVPSHWSAFFYGITMNLDIEFHDKQFQAWNSDADELLMGGAAGPGKSFWLWWSAVIHCLQYPGAKAVLFRRTFRELERGFVLEAEQLPKKAGVYHRSSKCVKFHNGSHLWLSNLEYPQDVKQHQSAQYSFIGFDELTHFEEGMYTYMFSRCRAPKEGIPSVMRAGTNPGGIGHQWVKARFVDIGKWGKKHKVKVGDREMTRQFIPAKIEDNPTLQKNNPNYVAYLNNLPEAERKALRDGDWDIFKGQAFPEWNREYHVIEPFDVPHSWHKVLVMDWGYAAPFDIQVLAKDINGQIYLIYELYGCKYELSSEKDPSNMNKGVGWDVPRVAEEIHRICSMPQCKGIRQFVAHKIWGRSKDEHSIASDFSDYKITFDRPASDDRVVTKQRLHDLLSINDAGVPGLRIFNTCHGFLRTFPGLTLDEKNFEDVKKGGQEDHPYDALRYGICSFGNLNTLPPPKRLDVWDRKLFNQPEIVNWKIN